MVERDGALEVMDRKEKVLWENYSYEETPEHKGPFRFEVSNEGKIVVIDENDGPVWESNEMNGRKPKILKQDNNTTTS